MDLGLIVLVSIITYVAIGAIAATVFGKFIRKTDERASILLKGKTSKNPVQGGKRAS